MGGANAIPVAQICQVGLVGCPCHGFALESWLISVVHEALCDGIINHKGTKSRS